MATHIYKKGALVRGRSYYDDERHRMDREREAGRTITASEHARRLVAEKAKACDQCGRPPFNPAIRVGAQCTAPGCCGTFRDGS